MIKYFAVFAIAAALSSCGLIDMKRERGNGQVQTESRPEKNFKGLESRGDFDVYVTTDSAWTVKIEGDENLLQYVKTHVENGLLKVDVTRGVSLHPTGEIKVWVTAPVFNRLSTAGSGSIKAQNQVVSDDELHLNIAGSGDIKAEVKAPSVSSEIAGSGSIKISGTAKSFSTSIEGDGSIDALALITEESAINIAGSGDAMVNVSRQLNVNIAGSGNVKYKGQSPSISQPVMGSGTIEKVE